MGRPVEAATSQHRLHLVPEIWIQQHRRNIHLLQVKTEHHRLVQLLLHLHLRRMVQLLIRLAFTQADFATSLDNHQTCK
jgi:hypothetical protein